MKKSLLQSLVDRQDLVVPPDAPLANSHAEVLEQLLQRRYASPFDGVHVHWVDTRGARQQALFLQWPVAQVYLVEQVDASLPGRDLKSCVDSILKRMRHLVARYWSFHCYSQGFARGQIDGAAGVVAQDPEMWASSDDRLYRMGYRAGHALGSSKKPAGPAALKAAWQSLRAEARCVLESGLPRLVSGECLPLLDAEQIWSDLTPL